MCLYEQSKVIEGKAIQFILDLIPKSFSFEKVEVNEYSPADLVIKLKDCYKCLEVKSRNYDLEFFKKYPPVCECYKLNKVKELYDVDYITLVTVTNDGYLLLGRVDCNSKTKRIYANKTTSFEDHRKVKKHFLMCEDFKIFKFQS